MAPTPCTSKPTFKTTQAKAGEAPSSSDGGRLGYPTGLNPSWLTNDREPFRAAWPTRAGQMEPTRSSRPLHSSSTAGQADAFNTKPPHPRPWSCFTTVGTKQVGPPPTRRPFSAGTEESGQETE